MYIELQNFRKALLWADKAIQVSKSSGQGFGQKGNVYYKAFQSCRSTDITNDDRIVASLAYKYFQLAEENNYNHIILTEVLPLDNNFIANKEFLDGPHTGMSFLESGIDITKNPFNFNYKNKIKLLEIKIKNYRLVTTAFEI